MSIGLCLSGLSRENNCIDLLQLLGLTTFFGSFRCRQSQPSDLCPFFYRHIFSSLTPPPPSFTSEDPGDDTGSPWRIQDHFSASRCLILLFSFLLDFLMWNMFKVFIVTILLLFYVFFGHEACGIIAPQPRIDAPRPGIESAPPALNGEVLTTEPPGKSLRSSITSSKFLLPRAITRVQILRTRIWTSLETHSSDSHVWWDSNVTCYCFFATPTSTEKDNILSFKRKMRSIRGSRERVRIRYPFLRIPLKSPDKTSLSFFTHGLLVWSIKRWVMF